MVSLFRVTCESDNTRSRRESGLGVKIDSPMCSSLLALKDLEVEPVYIWYYIPNIGNNTPGKNEDHMIFSVSIDKLNLL